MFFLCISIKFKMHWSFKRKLVHKSSNYLNNGDNNKKKQQQQLEQFPTIQGNMDILSKESKNKKRNKKKKEIEKMEKNGSFSKKESELIGLSRNVLIHRRKSSFLRSTAFDRTSNSCSVSYKARAWNEAVSICRRDSAGSKIAWARLKNLSSLRISYENEWDESNIYNNTLTYHLV